LTDTDNTRIARLGLAPITAQHGHALLDTALELPHPVLTASPLDQRTLRANSELGTLHPLLDRLTISPTTRRAGSPPGSTRDLHKDLADLGPEPRLRRLRTLVTTHAAAVLGLDDSSQIPADQPFKMSGFDSLTALELRNRLTSATGLRLPATLIYDHPTPDALADHLNDQLFPTAEEVRPTPAEDARIRRAIASIPVARLRELGLLDTLVQLADTDTVPVPAPGPHGVEDIETASVDELVSLAWSAEAAE
jgi:coronafacic acid polyketide synthase Cfa6